MIFEYSDLENNNEYLNSFFDNSVIQVNNLIDKKVCEETLDYFLTNENNIIKKYKDDSKGLVLDKIGNKFFIKYFEYPLSESFKYFGPFINNNVINLASKLLGINVFLRSMEIHTRGPGSTEIPPHQDNGYYGLEDSNALTFYIALNKQSTENGGLTYIPNRQGIEFNHFASKSKAFSLAIDSSDLPENKMNFEPKYNVGDCTIHHSNSIHFAKAINDKGIERSIVVRLSFFGTEINLKEGHRERYLEILKKNRSE